MRILGDITINGDDDYIRGLDERQHLKPFKSLMHALNTSLSYQSGQVYEAEGTMLKAAGGGIVSGLIAAAVYFSGQFSLAAIFCAVGLLCAVKYALARGARNAFTSELELMEERLINAGFRLVWSKARVISSRRVPPAVTLEWEAGHG